MEAFGSGNVFADLGIDNPEEQLAKADIVSTIASVIEKRELTQAEAGRIMGLPQPKVSALVRGKFEEFSIDRLYRLLNRLGVNVAVVLSAEPAWAPGQTSVVDKSGVSQSRRRPDLQLQEAPSPGLSFGR